MKETEHDKNADAGSKRKLTGSNNIDNYSDNDDYAKKFKDKSKVQVVAKIGEIIANKVDLRI